jgi:hypothetical protein
MPALVTCEVSVNRSKPGPLATLEQVTSTCLPSNGPWLRKSMHSRSDLMERFGGLGWFVLLRPSQGRDVLLLAAPCLSLLPNFVRDAPPQPGDKQVGDRSHAQLVRMDNRFRARLLRAFKRGKENRQAATASTRQRVAAGTPNPSPPSARRPM